ncbi:membrane protein of ER body 2 isoform X3 [Hevea brasiliensis]|uniref:membrane protein of ER body 2 isoform X3 n=1 Tax=Hevea brasiliensis TaxID=3981 RepID=UPI0025E7D3DE|nr:membrane protein of ER body 2 isoform X3 [Hevea brasiliensis]
MEGNQHKLVLEEEEEEEEEEAALQSRQSRRSNNNSIDAVVISSNGNGKGIVGSCGSSNDSSIESESKTANGTGYESPIKDVGEDGRLHNNSVYFDQHHGIWKCHHCNWTYCMGSLLIDHSQNIKRHLHMLMNVKTFNQQRLCFIIENKGTESIDGVFEMKSGSVASSISGTNCRDMDVHIKKVEVQKSLIKDINDQYGENFDDKGFSGSSLTPLEESHEEQNIKSKPINNETILEGDFDKTEETDQEETELDVETVLEKQNTHDLYCPNCSSCITRRVILRRRKPKIRNAPHKPKHNKSETDFHSELKSINTNSANFQVHDTVNNQSSGSPALAADANNRDREPEIFRCLSCFSFFIPTGDGFKLFRHFRESNITENENVLNVQKTTAINRNWFSSIFATDKKKMTIEQGGDALDNDIVDDVQQFNSKSSSETVLYQHRLHSEASVPGITGEPAEDASSGPLHGGVIFPPSSTCQSLVPGLSQMEIDKNVNRAKLEEQLVQIDIVETPFDAVGKKIPGGDVIVPVERRSGEPTASQMAQNVDGSTEVRSSLLSGTHTYMSEQGGAGVTVDILKSIVYGGLIESITSLSVVSSAAGAGSATWNILALGLANLIGGLFIIGHNLIDLKNDASGGSSNQINEQHEDRYQETLGRRENFLLHATVAILSFLTFGMLPPVVYGFSFRKSDNRDLKLAVVGGASLVCIILLAIGKAYTRRQPKRYISTILHFVLIVVMASGASYIVGDLIAKLVEKVGWSESSLVVPEMIPLEMPWASY